MFLSITNHTLKYEMNILNVHQKSIVHNHFRVIHIINNSYKS